MSRPCVWVTRTDPFNRLTAKRLAGAGYETLCAPALRVLGLDVPAVLAVPDALAFTSLNGVRLHRFLPALAEIPVFAVGDHSARLAQTCGYRRVRSASGNISDLAGTITRELTAPAAILHIGAARPAGDLGALLGPRHRVSRLAIYETLESDRRDLERVAGHIDAIDHMLIHSPRAGAHVARWLQDVEPHWRGTVHCISDAAAVPFRSFSRISIEVASRPDETSLLAGLMAHRPRSSVAAPRTSEAIRARAEQG